MKMMSKNKPAGASDAEVVTMLRRYHCPTPFHEVRTRFLGNIASPVLDASPMETVKQLWGGELPEFDSMDAANALFQVLVAGLWNRLTDHQSRRNPFRLKRFEVEATRESLGHLALVRRQELDGFVEGIFGHKDEIDLPERAHEALDEIYELRAMFAGAVTLLDDQSKPGEPSELKALLQNFQQITIIAETEMNKAVLACKRARGHAIATMVASKPTLH